MGGARRVRDFLTDEDCQSYAYEDLALVLDAAGFVCLGKSGSHRTWRRQFASGNVLRITLVNSGSGQVKAVYVRKMRDLLAGSAELLQEIDANG